MGRCLAPLLAPVGGHHLGIVHRQPLVGIDGDAEEARVGLKQETGQSREIGGESLGWAVVLGRGIPGYVSWLLSSCSQPGPGREQRGSPNPLP